MSGAFVMIWATGFIVARLVAPHAEPLTFLSARFGLTFLVFATAAWVSKARWPATARGWSDAMIAGMLMQGLYLGPVFWSVRHGLPAGIAALIAGLQPLLTALLAGPVLGERVRPARWAGIAAGFAGAALVLAPRAAAAPIAAVPLMVCIAGTVALTCGTIWQKRTGAASGLASGAAIQFLAAALVAVAGAAAFEHGGFDASPVLLAGLGWSVLGLSVGAASLLLTLIRRGAVAGVAALFYLVPPVAAVMAFLGFGEALSPVQIGGMGLAAFGVALASRS